MYHYYLSLRRYYQQNDIFNGYMVTQDYIKDKLFVLCCTVSELYQRYFSLLL